MVYIHVYLVLIVYTVSFTPECIFKKSDTVFSLGECVSGCLLDTPKHMGNLRQGNSSVSNDLSLSTTRSGQIQDRVKPFKIEEGQK